MPTKKKATRQAQSTVPGWPRLLSVDQAAAYLGLSFWTFRELVNAGDVPAVRVPRPNTPRMREQRALSDTIRRLLIDRSDLDALVERWKERR
jgi:excisionase family DNA binding protein